MPNLTGQSIGRYQILEQLGEGGMAIVYKAYDTRLERNVAFKVLRTDLFGSAIIEQILKRFEREAKSLAKLSHSNIVNILDYGEHEGSPYLVMEYLPGGTLKQKLGQAIPWQEAIQTLLPVARGLAYAHQHGVIHRDVKPANILMKEGNVPVLTDFGIAKLLEGADGHTLTASGVGIGTPEYMAPEQGIGAHTIDARADIYSLGIVLYEMVTGRKPYIADTPMAVVLKQMNDPLPRPADFVPNLPEGVEHILFKALAKQPDDRYADMDSLIAAMENQVTISQKIETATELVRPRRAEKKTLPRIKPSPKAAMAGIGALAVILVIVFGIPRVKQLFSSEPMATAISTISPVLPAPTASDPVQVNKTLWAESPHADAEAPAFTRWNDETPPEVPVACTKCHTMTGFLDYLGIDGSSIETTDMPVPAGEVLECATCHLNIDAYELRSLEAVVFPSGARLSFSHGDSNNLCIACHQGRNAKDTIDERVGTNVLDTSRDSLTFQNPHYDFAGATLFGVEAGGAYEYDGRVYDSRYLHVDGSNTCIDCHNPHSSALSIDKCATCHEGPFNSTTDLHSIRDASSKGSDYDGDGNTEEGIYGEIESLNQRLYTAIESYSQQRIGVAIGYRGDAYPFFFIDTNKDSIIQDDEAVAENQMKPWTPRLLHAAYNYQWAMKDPGAYTHNPRYIIQILYDTLKDLGADISALTRPTPSLSLIKTPQPPPTITPVPEWITNFAEPILAAINDREPYFQDDFGPDTKGWVSGYPNLPISIEEGVLRLKQGGSVLNIFLRDSPNFVLQVDISRPASCCTQVELSGDNSIYLGDSGWGICRPVWTDCTGNMRSFPSIIQVTVIVKGSQAGFYLMGIPVFNFEDSKLTDAGRFRNVMFKCDKFCEFDNVKFWDIKNIPIP